MRKFGLLILFAGLALAATTMAQTTAVSKRGVRFVGTSSRQLRNSNANDLGNPLCD